MRGLSGGKDEMSTGGQRAHEIPLTRVNVQRDVPDKQDIALAAQHRDLKQGNSWEGGNTATPRDHRLQGFRFHRDAGQEAGQDGSWEGRLCKYNQDTKVYLIYHATTHKVVECGYSLFIEVPSKVLPAPINGANSIHEMGEGRHHVFWRRTRGRRHTARRMRLHIAHRLYQRRDVRPYHPHRCTARPGDSLDPSNNPWIKSSGCVVRRRDAGSTGGRCRWKTITGRRRWRTATGSRWWKSATRGTRWRDGLQLRGSGNSTLSDASRHKEQWQGSVGAINNNRPAGLYTNTALLDMAQHMGILT